MKYSVTDCNHMSEFQNHYAEWSLYTRGHPAWLHLYEVLGQRKLIVGEKEIRIVVASGMG